MRNDSLQQFVRIRKELNEERERLQMRLNQINEALGEMPLPSQSRIEGTQSETAGAQTKGRRGRRPASGGQSLREHVVAVLQGGALTKEGVLAAVQKRGYKFSTSNPLNSLGVILYGKSPKLNRAEGKFSLTGGATKTQNGGSNGATGSTGSKRGGKRKMSPEARARIAAAQRARWAKQKSGK
jgi:hypothetical protein